jgi:hypothetical protein
MCTLVPLLEKEFTFKRLGETRIGARKADGVLVLRKGYPTVKLYFDTETSLLVKSEFQIKERVPPFKDVPCEFYFSDYREVKGVKFPHKRVAKHGPEVWDIMEISNLKSIDVVDPKLFEKPGK